jgi:hypothetical protein
MKTVRVEFNLKVDDKTSHKSVRELVKKGILTAFEESDNVVPTITSLNVDNVQKAAPKPKLVKKAKAKPAKKPKAAKTLPKRSPLGRAIEKAAKQ